ncbi:MAG: hypothetical protein ACI9GC_000961, partial [Phycisphaerales bacterium]
SASPMLIGYMQVVLHVESVSIPAVQRAKKTTAGWNRRWV